MATERSPFDVLGVRPTATEREIRRAYRRRVVTTHRTLVLGLVDRLKELTQAYEVLNGSSGTRDAAATNTNARSRAPSRREPSDSIGVRSPIAREMQRQSLRAGAEAQRENAVTVKAIADEYDAREAALVRARRWRRRIDVGGRLLLFLVVIALAAGVVMHFRATYGR